MIVPFIVKIISQFIIGLVMIYRYSLSYFMGRHCRFTPTCSQYTIEALQKKGLILGLKLSLKRIGTCHPWGGSGYDPVP